MLSGFERGLITLFLFYKRPVYKRREPEIYQNFKNKIRKYPGWDLVLVIFKRTFFNGFISKKWIVLKFFRNMFFLSLEITSFISMPMKSGFM